MPDISPPHENYEELFNEAFELAKQNLPNKKLSDEENKRFEELNNHIEMLFNKINSSKSNNLTPDPQLIEEQVEAVKEREAIERKDTGINDIHKDDSTIELFKKLNSAINKRVIDQIKKLEDSDKRCVLVIGGGDALIKGVISYVYYVYKCKNFCNYSAYFNSLPL